MEPLTTDAAGRRLAWAYLSAVADGPSQLLLELLQDMGPVEAARAVLDDDAVGAQRISAALQHLRLLDRIGGRLVTPDDDEWPTERLYPYTSTPRPDPRRLAPLCLWTIGQGTLRDLTRRAVTVTGTRAPTSYGTHVTTEIVADLAGAGCSIIAGASFGVDARAHRAALAASAPTVAVLACGLDVVHPAEHAELFRAIVDAGAIVSEYPPGTRVTRTRLQARARLLAVLTGAVVIPESGVRSGARVVAAHAVAIHRPVFAVPGPVVSAASTGCHDLIRAGHARLAATAGHILEVIDAASAEPTDTAPAGTIDDGL